MTVNRSLLNRALSTDAVVSRGAMKELRAHQYRYSNAEAKHMLALLPLPSDIRDDARRFEVFLRIMALVGWVRSARSHRSELLDLVWVGVVHPQGTVRQAARRLLETVRTSWSVFDDDTVEQYLAILAQIESLLKKYVPRNRPSSIEKAPPSVYKTLSLMWYDITDIPIVERSIDREQRMIEHDVLPYVEPQGEDNPTTYQLEDWQKHLEEYVVCRDPKKVATQLRQLQVAAEKQLKWALDTLGKDSLYKKIMFHAQFGESDALSTIVVTAVQSELVSARTEPEAMLTMFRLSKLARAVQHIDNNYVQKSRAGTPFSRIITDAIYYELDNMQPKKVVLDDVVEALVNARRSIDTLGVYVKKAARKSATEWERFCKQHGILSEEAHSGICSNDEIVEMVYILHYIVDKFTMDYKHLIRTPPEKIAAGLARVFTTQHPWLSIPGTEAQALAEFGGWKNASSLSSVVHDYQYRIRCASQDPSILLIVRCYDDLEFADKVE